MSVPAQQPHPRMVELSELLVGTWRVAGPDIGGRAEYTLRAGGHLLVLYVDFTVGGTRMRNIQHIRWREDSGVLQARYLDTMGDEATYTWVLDGRTIRVSEGEHDSDTYFQATVAEDGSEYVGTWHHADGGPSSEERIVYTRVALPEDPGPG